MPILADSAAAKVSRRLRLIPRHLQAIASLAGSDRYPRIARAFSVKRFSTKHLIIFVAVVAIFLGLLRVELDVWYCLQRATFHADMAAYHRGRPNPKLSPADLARLKAAVPRRPELAILHSRMSEKWHEAAAQPWLPVEPDPPRLLRTP
jgi:hypothetical protein